MYFQVYDASHEICQHYINFWQGWGLSHLLEFALAISDQLLEAYFKKESVRGG